MQVIYRANDGTEFDNTGDCLEYETKSKYLNYYTLADEVAGMYCRQVRPLGEFIIQNIEELSSTISANLKKPPESLEFTAGQPIRVRDSESSSWETAVFVRYNPDSEFPYSCEWGGSFKNEVAWRYAKAI